jgi:hypothetical protein
MVRTFARYLTEIFKEFCNNGAWQPNMVQYAGNMGEVEENISTYRSYPRIRGISFEVIQMPFEADLFYQNASIRLFQNFKKEVHPLHA